MGNFYMESTQINYRRDDKLKTVDQKLQELSETSAIDTDIAPVFKSTNTYQPGDMVYYRNKLYVFNVEHNGAWAAADVTATDVTSRINAVNTVLNETKADYADLAPAFNSESSYVAGDLVTYSGTVYRCTNDHTGAWDADDFSATTIGAELHEVNSNFIGLYAALSVPEGTGKNLLKVTASSTSGSGVTFTVNSDGTISLEGTATETVILTIGTFTFKENKSYVLSGCPDNGSTSTYLLSIQGVGYDSGEGYIYTPTSDQEKNIVINIYSGTNVDGKVFSPMIRPSGTTSDFAPYIPSVESRIEAVESASGVYVTADKSYEYTVNANAGTNITASDFNITTPAGYTPVAFSRVVTGSDDVIIRNMSPMKTGSTTMLGLYNTSGSAVTATAIVNVMYVKTGAVS